MEKSKRQDEIVVICVSPDQDLIVQGLLYMNLFKCKQIHTYKCYTIFFLIFFSELKNSNKSLSAFLFIVFCVRLKVPLISHYPANLSCFFFIHIYTGDSCPLHLVLSFQYVCPVLVII